MDWSRRRRLALRSWVELVLVLLGAVVTVTVATAPASAHDILIATAPTKGQTLAQVPAAVVLTFNDPALAMGTQIVVTGPGGQVQQGPPVLVDNTVSQPLAGDAPAGRYTVDWRVTSADGHPVAGTYSFSTRAAGTRAVSPTPTAGPVAPARGRGSVWIWVLIGVVVIAVAAVALLTIRRRAPARGISPTAPAEETLTGGNSGVVVRAGDTVRKTAGPWSPAVQSLLATLRDAGLTEVPKASGVDEQGRDVVSYLPGEVPSYPLPDWIWSDSILHDAGALLRRIHDASTELVHEELVWQLRTHHPVEVVCHNDVAPYNMVFSDHQLVGLIDFDTASPGPRIWDVAYLAYRIVPLGEDAGDGAPPVEARMDRLDALIEAYGLPFTRTEVLTAVVARLDELAVFTDGRAADTGRAEFRDHAATYRRDRDRIRTLAEHESGS